MYACIEMIATKMELINDFLWVEDKPQRNSKFLNNWPNAINVYLKSNNLLK